MASESGSSTTIIIVLIAVAVVAWMLFGKAERTVRNVNTSNKETYTTGTAISAVATNVAPALGQFLSGIFSSGSSSSSAGILGHGPSYGGSDYTYGDGDFDDSEEFV